tara:strand:+ start:1107 stop:1373 length:267 start_codon:yes stop_codon:yes gene_type:complete
MGIGTYFAIYFIFWWVTLFLVLPFSGKTQADVGDITLGTVKSAPAELKMLKVVILNTILCSLVFGAFYVSVEVLGLEFNDVLALFPKP